MHKLLSLFCLSLFAISIVGCGEAEIEVPEGTPATPEPGSDDYDQYNGDTRNDPSGSTTQ